jgi:hypothetical protein
MIDLDKAARRAQEANLKVPLHLQVFRGLKKWWADQPPVIVILFGMVALAVLVGLTLWEALNSARGWALLAKDAAPQWLAFIAGVAATVGYITFHRRAAENGREVEDIKERMEADPVPGVKPPTRLQLEKAEGRFWKAGAAAVAFAALSLWGIFSNLASKTGMVSKGAEEVNAERTQLQADIFVLEKEVGSFNGELVTAIITANNARMGSMVAEARGWGMKDLEPDGSCAEDLKPRQRDLCNAVNGSVDQMGLRGEIAALQADIDNHAKKVAELDAKKAELSKQAAVEGNEHWAAMQELSAGNIGADQFRIWGMFIASLISLFATGLGWDELFEQREKRRKAK